MSYSDVKDCRLSFSYPEEKVSDERFGAASSQSSPLLPQAIVFPYVGPPGSGPGLLGTRPGSNVMEFLVALEHHAASLKSALQVVQALKKKNDDSSSVESDSQKEDKKPELCAKVSSLVGHVPCECNKKLENYIDNKQPSSIVDARMKPVLRKQSSSDDSNSEFTINDFVEDFIFSSVTNSQGLKSFKIDAVSANVINPESYRLSTDNLSTSSSLCLDQIDSPPGIKCTTDNHTPHRRIFCSRKSTGDCSCENMHQTATKKDVEESCAVFKKKALRATRNGLHQFRKLMVEKEMSPQCKAVEGIILCLTSLCKEEELWNMKEDIVYLDLPL